MKFKEAQAVHRQLSKKSRELEDEDEGDVRKKKFGLLRDTQINTERRHPGFISAAKLLLDKDDK